MVHNLVAGIIGGFIKGMKDKAEENAKWEKVWRHKLPANTWSQFSWKNHLLNLLPNLDDRIEEMSIGSLSLSPSLYILKHAFILSAPFPLSLGVLNADDIEN